MAIEEQTARTVFKGDGSTRAFPVSWYLDAEEHVIVKMTNVTTAQVKTLELGTDYTVTPSDDEYPTNGAVINYPKNSVTPALGSDYRLTVIRNVPYTQSFVFPNNTRLLPKNIEGGLDGLELQIQQINDKADNAVSIPTGMDYNNDEFVAELFDKAKLAEQSAINAKASEANAKSSATNASQSAQTATTKANEAKASATSASLSAQTATTKANEAKESATSASQSAQTATTKAQEAISSATSAKKSETNAKASATNAKTSETNASQSAQTATTKANEASSSATNAKTSETNANSYKEQASLSAQTATTKANEASSSATNANQSATSAKTSEISASQSAQTATTKAQEASSSATNAKSSATSAKESEDKAQEYAERAENASSSIGNPVSNVTVDNNIITVTKGVGGSAYYTVDNVDNATHATTAGTADSATHATTAGTADSATHATTAGTADSATKATQDGSGNTITTHYLSRNQSTQNDMNACTVEGIYRFHGTLKNGWTGTSGGTLLVLNNRYNGDSGAAGTYLVQIALPTDGRMWTRQRVNTGAWTSWNKLANTTDCTDCTDTLKKVYPVGSIYMSTVSTNPATLLGFGTWEAMPAGHVLLAQGKSSWGTTYNAGSTGGEATHKLTVGELPTHSHTGSINAAGEHTHSLTLPAFWGDGDGRGNGWAGDTRDGGDRTNTFSTVGNHTHTVTINSTGSGQPHNNLQPYISVYMWKRTA